MESSEGVRKSVGWTLLKASYSSKIDVLLSTKGLINRYMVLLQSSNVAPDNL